MNLIRRASRKFRRAIRPVKTINDKYMEWLGYCNAGMLHPGNVYCFDHAIRNLEGAGPVVEIGAFCGLSTNTIAYLLSKHGKKNAFFSCDLWDYDPDRTHAKVPGTDLGYLDFNQYITDSYLNNLKMFNAKNLPYPIKGSSAIFFERWERRETVTDLFGRTVTMGGPISMAYIDGDHSYRGVKIDFEGVDKSLEVGGFILFDDSSVFQGNQVHRLMKEILRRRDYRMVMKNPNYLFQKIS